MDEWHGMRGPELRCLWKYCTVRTRFHKGLRQISASHAPTVSIPLLSLRYMGSCFSLAVNEGALSIRKDAFVWIWRMLCNLSLCWVIVPYRILGLGRQMAVYPVGLDMAVVPRN